MYLLSLSCVDVVTSVFGRKQIRLRPLTPPHSSIDKFKCVIFFKINLNGSLEYTQCATMHVFIMFDGRVHFVWVV